MELSPWKFTELDAKLFDRMSPCARRDFFRRKFMPRIARYLYEYYGLRLRLVEQGIGVEMIATFKGPEPDEVHLEMSNIRWKEDGKPIYFTVIQKGQRTNGLTAIYGANLNQLWGFCILAVLARTYPSLGVANLAAQSRQ